MLGEDVPGQRWRRTSERLGWAVVAVLSALLGLVLIVGVLATGDGLVSPAFLFTLGIFSIIGGVGLLLVQSLDPTKAAAARRVRHTTSAGGVPGVDVGLRRSPEIFGVLAFVCVFALALEAAAAAVGTGHPLLGTLLGGLAVPVVPVIVETVTTWRCRRALVLTPETLAIERSADRIELAWDDVESVDMDVNSVRISGIIPFRYAYVVVRPMADATSLTIAPRRRFRIRPRRYPYDGILISTTLLDHPERVRHLLDTMRRRPRRGNAEQGRQDVLSSAVDRLTADVGAPFASTTSD